MNTNKNRRHTPERALIHTNRHKRPRLLRVHSLPRPLGVNDVKRIAKTHKQQQKETILGPGIAPVRTDRVCVCWLFTDTSSPRVGNAVRFQLPHFRDFNSSVCLRGLVYARKAQSCLCVVFLRHISIWSNCVCDWSKLAFIVNRYKKNKRISLHLNFAKQLSRWMVYDAC